MSETTPAAAAPPHSHRGKQVKLRMLAFPLFVALAVVLAALAGCGGGSSGGSSNTLTFGAPISLTGSLSHEGTDTLHGYQMWVDAVNSHGGLKVGNTTYKVALKYYDDASSTTKSAQLTQTLVTKDKVNFLLGPYGTAATLSDENIAAQYQIPMVEGNGASEAIFSKGNKYIFGVLSPASTYAKIMIQAALSLSNPPKTIGIIHANDSFSVAVAKAADDFAKSSGMTVVADTEYPADAPDLTNVLTPLKTAVNGGPPDFLLGSGHEDEALVTMKQAKQLGINFKLYGFTVGPALPDFITTLGGDANFVMGSSQWTPQVKYQGKDYWGTAPAYESAYKAKYNQEPSYQAAESTAAALAFQFAIQNAGSIDPAKVRDALASLDVTTFYGELKFDSTGKNVTKPMVTIQIQNGVVQTVFPADVANATLQYPTPPFGSR
ncbi:MAG TPA: amino acid ABC transporter substrate-binding protein [Ktedonobacterales bacterium]